jgi:hypothetical protein
VLAAGLAVGTLVLRDTVVTDDEHAYRFIARTLRTGHLVAPSPGGDLEFYREQFVVVTPDRRYGKYPVGHPALLAVGQVLGAERLVVPLVSALAAWPVALLAWRLYGPREGVLAVVLFATSPQVLLTAGTLLSQPLSMLLAAAAAACLVRVDSPRGLAWAGILLGLALHVRPLPGALFVAAAGLWLAVARRPSFMGWASFVLPVAAAAAGLLAVNLAQTGGALSSGYQEVHQTGSGLGGFAGLLGGSAAVIVFSLLAALLRLLAWLTGWPFAVALGAAAPPVPGRGLLVAFVLAELAYRVVSPKAGVGLTGPVYMLEAVPFLCVLAAAGLLGLAGRIAGDASRGAAVLVLAGLGVHASMFLPAQLPTLARSAAAHRVLPRLLAEKGVGRAVVFHNGAVPLLGGLSWAYYPPFNGPRLDDDLLYLRLADPSWLPAAHELWRQRYADRPAYWFTWDARGPRLVPFEAR